MTTNASPWDGHTDIPAENLAEAIASAPDLAAFRLLVSAMAAGDTDGVQAVLADAEQRGLVMLLAGAADYVVLVRHMVGDDALVPWLNARALRQLDAVQRIRRGAQ